MGTCYSKNGVKSHRSRQETYEENTCKMSQTKATEEQIECLRLIYQDLVQRNSNKTMDSRTLEFFFHMNPVLSTSLARKFVLQNNGNKQITEEMFVNAAIRYVKGRLQQKLKFLFCLYDLDESQGLSFNQLLAILLNSPQEELKQILTNDDFLRTLSTQQISYYILTSANGSQQQCQQQNKLSISLFPHLPVRKKSTQIIEQDPAFQSFTNTQPKKSMLQICPYSSRQLIEDLKKKIDKSLHTTQLIRRYSQYVFKSNNLDVEHQEMSFEVFKFLVKSHPKIYQQCFQGFHQYLWLHVNGVAFYKRLIHKIAGYCEERCGDVEKKVYLVHLKNSLITFNDENMAKPISIKNLEGLNIQQLEEEDRYGFVLRHMDGFYPECRYYFDQQTQKKWLNSLKDFLQQSVFKMYKLEQKIGKGSFCNVYKCQNLKTGEKKAIKIINKSIMSPTQISAINSESQILATCAMPNVLRAYQRFQTKQNIYIITQLIQGGTLYEYVKRNSRKYLQEKQCCEIMRQLLRAVANLHQIGIIHRDLKLENILMKNQGGHLVPKIIDFGLAIYKIDLINIDQRRKYVGTPNFVGPEIFMHEEYNQNVDVFSLGVIMHFLLTGSLPFNAAKIQIVRELTMECHINFETKRWLNISDEAKDLLSKMLVQIDHRISAADALQHEWFHRHNY